MEKRKWSAVNLAVFVVVLLAIVQLTDAQQKDEGRLLTTRGQRADTNAVAGGSIVEQCASVAAAEGGGHVVAATVVNGA
ncbi:Hypp6931 [Branchiostoma lanceolatum]|uniref:Hypp6931 protein n=1 Tax=Branchiostoma lanceolatum TaxID=7740 RepID=A0A8J9YVP7_BRALA|nr:Hypp6931 [Branchiostoma lanceolatum]